MTGEPCGFRGLDIIHAKNRDQRSPSSGVIRLEGKSTASGHSSSLASAQECTGAAALAAGAQPVHCGRLMSRGVLGLLAALGAVAIAFVWRWYALERPRQQGRAWRDLRPRPVDYLIGFVTIDCCITNVLSKA